MHFSRFWFHFACILDHPSPGQLFGETEIHHLDVTLGVKQQILGFKITVNVVHLVQMLESGEHTRRVKAGILLWDMLLLQKTC